MPVGTAMDKAGEGQFEEGPIKLVASNGQSIHVESYFANYSKIVEKLLDPQYGFEESQTRTIYFSHITMEELQIAVEYVRHLEKCKACPEGSQTEYQIPEKMALNMLLVADFLDIPSQGSPRYAQGDATAEDSNVTVKFVLGDVLMALDSGELEYEGSEHHETFSRISTDIKDASGTLYLTQDNVCWFNEGKSLGLCFGYPDVVLHALVDANESACNLFMQVEAGELLMPDATKLAEEAFDPQEIDGDCGTWDLTLTLGGKDVAERIFEVLTTCTSSGDLFV